MATRNTIPVITKYELACILSQRATEIADGQPITIRNPGTNDPVRIAELEYAAGKTPKTIERVWPDGRKEVWKLNELRNFLQ